MKTLRQEKGSDLPADVIAPMMAEPGLAGRGDRYIEKRAEESPQFSELLLCKQKCFRDG